MPNLAMKKKCLTQMEQRGREGTVILELSKKGKREIQ